MRTSHENISLNLNIRGLQYSATVAINELSNSLRSQGTRVYKLGLGQSPFPVPDPVVSALKENAHQKDYLPVQGLKALREAVASYYARNDIVDSHPDHVLIGPGSKELMFLLQLAYYGDLVIPTPCWVSYAPQAQIVGRKVNFLHTDFSHRWRLQAEHLENLCASDPHRPRIVVLNYPGNPEGSTYSITRLKEIARVARKYRVILLSDEIYGMLQYEEKHVSVARFYPEGTIVSSGLSKWCGAGGWRLGTFTFPSTLKWLLDAMASIASETYTSTSAPIQHAAVRAFQGGPEIEEYLVHCRRILSALGHWSASRLKKIGARVIEPRGAFYLFPDFSPLAPQMEKRGITTSPELCERILQETGVAILPGKEFGRQASELTARIAFVDFDGKKALEASRELPLSEPLDEGFMSSYLTNTFKAIDILCEWFS